MRRFVKVRPSARCPRDAARTPEWMIASILWRKAELRRVDPCPAIPQVIKRMLKNFSMSQRRRSWPKLRAASPKLSVYRAEADPDEPGYDDRPRSRPGRCSASRPT